MISWKIAEEDKKDILKFLNDAEIGKLNKGKKIGNSRLIKYLDLLKYPFEMFKKPVSKITIKDIEDFEKKISKAKYTDWTKVGIKRALIIYLRWKLGESKATELTGWLDVRKPFKTPDYLTEPEVEKLFKLCKNNQERFLIAVLFDTGCRAEEFHNIRKEDVILPSGNEAFVKIALKEEYSKTKGRTISLYWKNSLNAVKDYLDERIEEGIKANEPIFKSSYDLTRQFLNRLGKKKNKKLHYHLFRHSSATYYATRLNRQELCYRYGWSFSSDMPDVYISRSGMESKQLDEKFKATELEEIEKKFEKDKFEKDKQIETLNKKFNDFTELMESKMIEGRKKQLEVFNSLSKSEQDKYREIWMRMNGLKK